MIERLMVVQIKRFIDIQLEQRLASMPWLVKIEQHFRGIISKSSLWTVIKILIFKKKLRIKKVMLKKAAKIGLSIKGIWRKENVIRSK